MPSMFKIFMRSEGVKIVFLVHRLKKAFICDFSLKKRNLKKQIHLSCVPRLIKKKRIFHKRNAQTLVWRLI